MSELREEIKANTDYGIGTMLRIADAKQVLSLFDKVDALEYERNGEKDRADRNAQKAVEYADKFRAEQQENQRLREALIEIMDTWGSDEIEKIAKQALKTK